MKYKSYGFWTALAGALTLFVGTLTKSFGISFNVEIIEDVIMAFAGILVVLGIVCMPIDKEKNPDKDDANENAEVKKSSLASENLGNEDDCTLKDFEKAEETDIDKASLILAEKQNQTSKLLKVGKDALDEVLSVEENDVLDDDEVAANDKPVSKNVE